MKKKFNIKLFFLNIKNEFNNISFPKYIDTFYFSLFIIFLIFIISLFIYILDYVIIKIIYYLIKFK
ncbi:preprotein translocase subunit SecE [endosymbiont of Euscepes postfasciatus]|uniref:preprotein translocase subunit SecE n=1 Tax=endosymbiont of Euscepes postfasciatus TaxID=650377 RepID=UPI00102F0598